MATRYYDEKWQQNINIMLQNNVPHLSCYAMTVEPETALASFIKKKQTPPIDNAQSAKQFEYLMQILKANGTIIMKFRITQKQVIVPFIIAVIGKANRI